MINFPFIFSAKSSETLSQNNRFVEDWFHEPYIWGIGVDFKIKRVFIQDGSVVDHETNEICKKINNLNAFCILLTWL